ncbi:Phosphoglycolate phosphatase [hydrothermal vent metagenome]|uniref:Phosphoglycolate phosphatase n=1 Tax=hydrothermal vent metagenome TaxID=652676 RepID=A0A3B1CV87_9ZZZZ
MEKIRLIIFDLDGTLVDSSRDITNALNYALKPYGFKAMTVEETVKLVGEGISRLIEKVIGTERMEIKNDVLRRFLEFYSDHLTEYTRPYPDVTDTLDKLSTYGKAVISNKREELSRRLLEELGMASCFNHILGSDSTPEKKPSPLPVLTVLKREGLTPAQALMVGDSNLDIEAGRKAGVITVGAGYGYRPLEALKGADFLIRERLVELLEILKKIQTQS